MEVCRCARACAHAALYACPPTRLCADMSVYPAGRPDDHHVCVGVCECITVCPHAMAYAWLVLYCICAYIYDPPRGVCVRMHVYMHVGLHSCMIFVEHSSLCVWIYVCGHDWLPAHMHACQSACWSIGKCTCMSQCRYVGLSARMYARMNAWRYACMHVHMPEIIYDCMHD